ncbi:unnamed protein product, partial [Meganyctiphanes norvegica]
DLPPYTPQGPSSQNSQASTEYTRELDSHPSIIQYSQDSPVYSNSLPSYPSYESGFVQPVQLPPMYEGYNDISHQQLVKQTKTPPPTAPKPNANICSSILTASDPKWRNVTQV